jgi:beta-N-acetylhexosaminidase
MMSHAVVPAWDPALPASLSPAVMGTWLRGELAFPGLILADDFSMGAASDYGTPAEAAVAAIIAGADMVMAWPKDLAATHAAILAALRSGALPRSRLVEAAAQVLRVKLEYGILH